ncbi:MAG: Lrp/AsnC family transcriptional regulator [Firmicutes bacterium]|nr:Lrp/AsnC family transcriptional regulator [Bacillota bacterium]
MDALDLKIIGILKQNSRTTSSEISRQINLSIPAVAERIRKLEEARVIERYTLKLKRSGFGLNLLAFILVNVDPAKKSEPFRALVEKEDRVLECHHVAGEYDFLLKVAARDTEELEQLISNRLKKTAGVTRTNTIVVLTTAKEGL